MANLPDESCTEPVNLPLTVSPSPAGSERQRFVRGHLRTDAGDLALTQAGEEIAPIGRATIRLADSVTLFDVMLATPSKRVAHLAAETGWSKIGRIAGQEPPVEPGRSVRADLALQSGGGEDADIGTGIAARIIGRSALGEVFGDAPLIDVDALDDACTAQRLQAADVGIDKTL